MGKKNAVVGSDSPAEPDRGENEELLSENGKNWRSGSRITKGR